MPKPSTLFGWTAAGTTPSTTLKTNGYVSGDRLPANHVDWWLKLITDWIDGYLNTLDSSDNIWTGLNTFKLVVSGNGLLSSLADSLLARYSAEAPAFATAARVCVFKGSIVGLATGVLVYLAPADSTNEILNLEIVLNAQYTSGGVWSRLRTGRDAMILRLYAEENASVGGVTLARRIDSGGATWTDTYDVNGWTTILSLGRASGGGTEHVVTGDVNVTGSVYADGGVQATAGNVVVSAGNLTVSGSVSAGSGIYTSEHYTSIDNYAGGSEQFCQFANTVNVVSAGLPRVRAGSLVGFRVLIDAAVGATLTVTVEKRAGGIGGTRTVLGTATIVDPATDQTGLVVGGNTYAASDVLIVVVSTAGAITPRDIAVMIQLQE
jgi:hypothetical protein